MYVYQNKETGELVVAIRFSHYSEFCRENIAKLFRNYPYHYHYTALPSGYVDEEIIFIDYKYSSCVLRNLDWLVCLGENKYEHLTHSDFKEKYIYKHITDKDTENIDAFLLEVLKGLGPIC